MAGRHGKYLYQRKGSANWYLRLVYPPELHGVYGKRKEISLRTADRDEALVKALPTIREHKERLIVVRSLIRSHDIEKAYRYEPNREYVNDDGSKVVATAQQVIHIDREGAVTNIAPNEPRQLTVWRTTPSEAQALGLPVKRMRLTCSAKDADTDLQLLQDFLDLQPRTKHYEADVRRTWMRWKEFVSNRPLSKCSRADGQAFVRHLKAQDPPPAPVTLRKWISYLRAPVSHGLPKHDPRQDIFHRLIGKVTVQTKRLPLSEIDMAMFREKALPKLGPEERLLWILMATTGMRPSECASVREEFEEDGVRYVMLGVDAETKTGTSARRIPLPDPVLAEPTLPSLIRAPLFLKNHVITIKNLNRALRRIGIKDKRKVVYSLRHRAHDRLRAAGCPRDVQLQLVGHDEATVHDGYGRGYPVAILKEWIERIGY